MKGVVKKKTVSTKPSEPPVEEVVAEKLNPKQEMFCRLYATDRDSFGNGTRAYMKAYGLKESQYTTARSNAQRLLTNADICRRIGELLDLTLNDTVVDRELAFVITQHDNLAAKMAAIKEYNRIKKRASDSEPTRELKITWGQ